MFLLMFKMNNIEAFFFQLKVTASGKMAHCENVKIDWGLNEVIVLRCLYCKRFLQPRKSQDIMSSWKNNFPKENSRITLLFPRLMEFTITLQNCWTLN